MPILETKQEKYYVLKTLGVDDTALVWSGASQTVDNFTIAGATIEIYEPPTRANAAIVVFHGTDAANETLNWMLVGWRGKDDPAEFIANGTAILGTQRVAKATAAELWADTISITSQKWLTTVSVVDSGNNRMAKLAFDLCGLKRVAAVIQKSTAASTGAKICHI